MTFQSAVNRVNTYGIQGDLANGQVPHYSATTPRVAAGETVVAGGFVWVKDLNAVSSAYGKGEGAPTGIAQRVKDVPNMDIRSEGTLTIPAGRKVDVVVWGDIFVKTTDSATVGNALFVNNTTGAITNAASGTSVAGATETAWKIVSLANNAASAQGSVVIASNVSGKVAPEVESS